MTKAKKVLSLVLAVVMVAAMFAFSASAVASQEATLTVTPSATTVQIGEEVTVTVTLTTDYYAAATAVPVYYDPAVFSFVEGSVDGADIFGAGATDVQFHNDAATGCLKVAFIPQGASAKAQVLTNKTLFTFKLKAIANGQSAVKVKEEDQKTSKNAGGTLYCGAYATSSVTSEVDMYDQTFTITNTTVTVGAAAAPELQLTERGAEIGAIISKTHAVTDGYAGRVMGIDTLGFGVDYVTATLSECLTTPAGKIRIKSNAPGGAETTGTLIELCDDSGTVLETYVFIYFGDVNKDASVDTLDSSLIAEYCAYMSDIPEEYALVAADVNGDASLDTLDSSLIEEYCAYISDLPTQATVAAKYAK